APDLVATLDDDNVLVAECTVVTPTTQDIEELRGKALSLAQGLRDQRQSAVYMILFHATQHGVVHPDTAGKARETGVRMIGLAALESCEQMLRRGEPKEFVRSLFLEERRQLVW